MNFCSFYVDQLSHLLVLLSVFRGLWLLRTLIFRENWVGSKVAGTKITFFAIFDTSWTHILVPKGPNKEFLKQHFIKERQKFYYIVMNFVTLILTS